MDSLLDENSVSLRVNNLPFTERVLDGSLRLENLLELLAFLRLGVLFLSSWQILLWLWLAGLGDFFFFYCFLGCFLLLLSILLQVNHFSSLCSSSFKFCRLVFGLLIIVLLDSGRFWNILHIFRNNFIIIITFFRWSIFGIIITLFFWRWTFLFLDLLLRSGLFNRFSLSSFLCWRLILFRLIFLLLFDNNLLSFFLSQLLLESGLFFSF